MKRFSFLILLVLGCLLLIFQSLPLNSSVVSRLQDHDESIEGSVSLHRRTLAQTNDFEANMFNVYYGKNEAGFSKMRTNKKDLRSAGFDEDIESFKVWSTPGFGRVRFAVGENRKNGPIVITGPNADEILKMRESYIFSFYAYDRPGSSRIKIFNYDYSGKARKLNVNPDIFVEGHVPEEFKNKIQLYVGHRYVNKQDILHYSTTGPVEHDGYKHAMSFPVASEPKEGLTKVVILQSVDRTFLVAGEDIDRRISVKGTFYIKPDHALFSSISSLSNNNHGPVLVGNQLEKCIIEDSDGNVVVGECGEFSLEGSLSFWQDRIFGPNSRMLKANSLRVVSVFGFVLKNNQKWEFSNGEIKSLDEKIKGYCLEHDLGAKIHISKECHGGLSQQFIPLEQERIDSVEIYDEFVRKQSGVAIDMQSNYMTGRCLYIHDEELEVSFCEQIGQLQPVFFPDGTIRFLDEDELVGCLDARVDEIGIVYLNECHLGKNQQWAFKDGYLRPKHETLKNHCFEMVPNLNVNPCFNWRQRINIKGVVSYRVPLQWRSKFESHKCVDWYGGKTVKLNECSGNKYQDFYLQADESIRLDFSSSEFKCLEYPHKESNELKFSRCNHELNQRWEFSNGKIKSRVDGKCIDVHMSGKNLYLHECHGGDNQKFKFFENSNEFQIKLGDSADSAKDDPCLHYGGDGDDLEFRTCNDEDTQSFRFDGYAVESFLDRRCLEVKETQRTIKVSFEYCDKSLSQIWIFKDNALMAANTNLCQRSLSCLLQTPTCDNTSTGSNTLQCGGKAFMTNYLPLDW